MTTLNPPNVWAVPEQCRTIYTHAREAPPGRTLFVSGQIGIAPDGRMHAGFAEQLEQAMANVEALLSAAGMALADVTRATFILIRAADLAALDQARRVRWSSDAPAAVTVIVAAALGRLDALIEVEVTAVRRPELHAGPVRPGWSVAGMLGRVARRAWGLMAAYGDRVDSFGAHGDWLLRDLGLDRADVESGAKLADERRRRLPYQ